MAYATQMDAAKQGIITKEMEIVAKKEFKTPEEIRRLVACVQFVFQQTLITSL